MHTPPKIAKLVLVCQLGKERKEASKFPELGVNAYTTPLNC